MSDFDSLTLKDVSDKLHIGEATLNVWRNRYKIWMPSPLDQDQGNYPGHILDVFRMISKCTNAGMENHEISQILESMYGKKSDSDNPQDHRDKEELRPFTPHQDQGVLLALKELVSGLVVQQARIADAQERRAAAEERMAFAMESRAENDMINVGVMRELVSVIQDMSLKGSVNSLMERVKSMPGPSPAELEDFSSDMAFDMDQLEDLPSPEPEEQDQLEELYSPDDGSETELSPGPSEDHETVVEASCDMDDLTMLLEPQDLDDNSDMDDLSVLLEPADLQIPQDTDDLSLLLDEKEKAVQDVDDLSLLVDAEPVPVAPEPVVKTREIEKSSTKTAAVTDESYKSKILKRIIQMKQKEGLSVEETTKRFNDEAVKTLTGKGQWEAKTIQGIYKYIDSFK